MAWSYDLTQLATSPLMQVRFRIGDVIEADQLLQDEEINLMLIDQSVDGASLKCLDAIITRLRAVDFSAGPYSERASQRMQHLLEIRADMRRQKIGKSAPLFSDPGRKIFDIDMMSPLNDCVEGESL